MQILLTFATLSCIPATRPWLHSDSVTLKLSYTQMQILLTFATLSWMPDTLPETWLHSDSATQVRPVGHPTPENMQ